MDKNRTLSFEDALASIEVWGCVKCGNTISSINIKENDNKCTYCGTEQVVKGP